MEDKQLKEGISMLYDMEMNNYFMSETIRNLKEQASRLGYAKSYRKPYREKFESVLGIGFFTIAIVGGIIGILIGAVYGFIGTHGFWNTFNDVLSYGVLGGAIGAAVGGCIGIIYGTAQNTKLKSGIEARYSKDMSNYEKALKDDEKRVKSECSQRDFLIKQQNRLAELKRNAATALSEFYDKMNIDPKYRNLICMGYMEEFIRLGIATQLNGADGLYYLIRKELRQDQMQCSLDEISEKLDSIIDRQNNLYEKLTETNRKCDSIVRAIVEESKQLNNISESVQISAYNSERILQEEKYRNFMITCSLLSNR